jgi:hypothetical protein
MRWSRVSPLFGCFRFSRFSEKEQRGGFHERGPGLRLWRCPRRRQVRLYAVRHHQEVVAYVPL